MTLIEIGTLLAKHGELTPEVSACLTEHSHQPPSRELIEALNLGEAACLSMIIFEPITTNQSKWERASKIIRMERERLEAAKT